ncbi:MAG: hypothetical protein ACOZAM_23135 [Pseudomonadota bacterium]
MTWDRLTDPMLSFLLTVIFSIAVYLLRPRVRLVWSQTHLFHHRLKSKQPTDSPKENPTEIVPAEFGVQAASIMVQNRGRATAEQVEITLNWKPWGLSVWPQRPYTENVNPEGRLTIQLPTLASAEVVTVNMIDNVELPALLTVRSSSGLAREVNTLPAIQYPKPILIFIAILMFVGFFTIAWFVIYLAVAVLRWRGLLP